jgi:hypothetical protein
VVCPLFRCTVSAFLGKDRIGHRVCEEAGELSRVRGLTARRSTLLAQSRGLGGLRGRLLGVAMTVTVTPIRDNPRSNPITMSVYDRLGA